MDLALVLGAHPTCIFVGTRPVSMQNTLGAVHVWMRWSEGAPEPEKRGMTGGRVPLWKRLRWPKRESNLRWNHGRQERGGALLKSGCRSVLGAVVREAAEAVDLTPRSAHGAMLATTEGRRITCLSIAWGGRASSTEQCRSIGLPGKRARGHNSIPVSKAHCLS
jgi:hypothetical protein